MTVTYRYAHPECTRKLCFSCTFQSVDYACQKCGVIMKQLPMKMIYCEECANELQECPHIFCRSHIPCKLKKF